MKVSLIEFLIRHGPGNTTIHVHSFASILWSERKRIQIGAAFRNVMKVARDEGVIDRVPDTPRSRQHDNPRPFFRFYPLVGKEEDSDRSRISECNEGGSG